MFNSQHIGQSARSAYKEAYRARRLMARIDTSGFAGKCRDTLIEDMLTTQFGIMALWAYISFADRRRGIYVNWKLRDRLKLATKHGKARVIVIWKPDPMYRSRSIWLQVWAGEPDKSERLYSGIFLSKKNALQWCKEHYPTVEIVYRTEEVHKKTSSVNQQQRVKFQ